MKVAPKIAVTGASGFVGRHVLAELVRRDVAATVLLRPATTAPDWLQGHRIVRMDIADSPTDAFELAGRPDVLIHLAWGGLPNYKSLHHFEQELPAQYRFLKAMVGAGLRHLVVSGTCFEYGMQSGSLTEEMPAAPTNPYGLAKDMLRRQLQHLQQARLQQAQAFSLAWARLFYLHGQGQAPNSLLPLLQRAVERGDASFPMSGGEQLRDYLSAPEVAQHLVTLALAQRDCGIVNICSGQPTSVRALVEGWIAANGWAITPALGHFPYPDHEPMAFWGDRRKLDRCLAAASSPFQTPQVTP
ncbi:MAG: epimerase [Methylibium sp. NZG]|nr:MAG: epimerase [Methylibium sp. NZG]